MKKVLVVALTTIPVFIMVGLIPLVSNDYLLSLIYCFVIAFSFWVRYFPKDWLFFVLGLVSMACFEAVFISTRVEVFTRDSLFGLMPTWLPILWGYGFVVIKRAIEVLSKD